jgi:hypothetical protein
MEALVRLLPLLSVAAVPPEAWTASADTTPSISTCALANSTAYDTLHVPGLGPAPAPLNRVPDTASAAACCDLCSAHAGCLYFTLYPNRTCVLLKSFGGPRVLAGAVSGSTVTRPAPVSFVRHTDPGLLAALKSLPRLPKPHYAWPILPTGDVGIYTSDPYVHEFSRISGAMSFSAEFANRERTFLLVRAAAAANASLGVHYWGMWKRIFPAGAPPTYNGPEASAELARFERLMRNASTWIADANAQCVKPKRPVSLSITRTTVPLYDTLPLRMTLCVGGAGTRRTCGSDW